LKKWRDFQQDSMKQQLKVMTVVGTRPEIIRLSRVIAKLDASEVISHLLVHTGQNYDYELNQIFFDDLGIRKPDYFLNAASTTPSGTIGQILTKIDELLEKEKPDAFLVLGDTNSCLCTIPAKKRHVPIFHMEAGNRCFDQRVPEETNRKIVDHISDINLTYSDIAREYLLREGLPPDRIIKTGSPMFEVLHHYLDQIRKSDILQRLDLRENEYFVVSSHREENINDEKNFLRLIETMNAIARTYELPIIVTTHPRTRKMMESKNVAVNSQVRFLKPLSFSDYIALQMNARAVLSDSGTISEESSILNIPALNIREAHERPEAMEETAVMMVGLRPERVLQGLAQLRSQRRDQRDFRLVGDYSMPNVSDKIPRIILSYTDYIRRNVWREPGL
jgi:UDP-N-acetyl-L-fucosamine synthase